MKRRVDVVVCFQCGQPVGDPPTLNQIDGDEGCPTCAERVLASVPPIFHSPMPFLMRADPDVDETREWEDANDLDEPPDIGA